MIDDALEVKFMTHDSDKFTRRGGNRGSGIGSTGV